MAYFPNNNSDEIIGLSQQRKMADILRQQSQEQNQGQMVSGHYVAPSWTQGLAKVLQGVGASYIDNKADGQQRDYNDSKAKKFAEILSGNKPQQVADGAPVQNTAIPAYEPSQQDRFGSPLPNVERKPVDVGAPVQNMRQESPEEVSERQQNAMAEYLGQYGGQGAAENYIIGQQTANENRQSHQQELAETRALRTQEAQAQRDQRTQELEFRLEDSRLSRQERAETQRQLAQMQIEARHDIAGMQKQNAAQPYFQPVQTAQGVMSFNARTGKMEPISINGGNVLGAQYDPNLQGQIAGAKESWKVAGGAQADAKVNLPGYVAEAENTVKLVDDLLAAPGFKTAVGGSRWFGAQNIPGTPAKDFDVRLDQLKGKQFLEAFQSLKGGGAITEVEGAKATQAISRMDAASSEEEFIKAAREFQTIIKSGVERAKAKAGGGAPLSLDMPPAGAVRRIK